MLDEIKSGIQNAMERGYSLEEAVNSFISAGYNPVEVREAANALSTGVTNVVNPNAKSAVQQRPAASIPARPLSNPNQSSQQQPQQSNQISVTQNPANTPSSPQQNNIPARQPQVDPNSNSFSSQLTSTSSAQNTASTQVGALSSSTSNPESFSPQAFAEKRSTMKKKILIILIILLILLIGVLALGFFFGDVLLKMINGSS